MVDVAQALLGMMILIAPGAAAVWALVGRWDWPKAVFAGVVVGFTVTPSLIYLLNVFFGVPISPMNFTLASLGLTAVFLAMALRPRLEAVWASA